MDMHRLQYKDHDFMNVMEANHMAQERTLELSDGKEPGPLTQEAFCRKRLEQFIPRGGQSLQCRGARRLPDSRVLKGKIQGFGKSLGSR
jgi:hypothetical protein